MNDSNNEENDYLPSEVQIIEGERYIVKGSPVQVFRFALSKGKIFQFETYFGSEPAIDLDEWERKESGLDD